MLRTAAPVRSEFAAAIDSTVCSSSQHPASQPGSARQHWNLPAKSLGWIAGGVAELQALGTCSQVAFIRQSFDEAPCCRAERLGDRRTRRASSRLPSKVETRSAYWHLLWGRSSREWRQPPLQVSDCPQPATSPVLTCPAAFSWADVDKSGRCCRCRRLTSEGSFPTEAGRDYGRQAKSTALGELKGHGGCKRACGCGAGGAVAEAADAGAEHGRRKWMGGGWILLTGAVGVDVGARDDVFVDAL